MGKQGNLNFVVCELISLKTQRRESSPKTWPEIKEKHVQDC